MSKFDTTSRKLKTMARQFDPVEEALEGFSRLRGSITQQILTLPGPDPFRKALMEMDRGLSKVEDDLVRTAMKVSPLDRFWSTLPKMGRKHWVDE